MNDQDRDQIVRDLEAAYPLADAESIAEMFRTIVGPSKEVPEHEVDETPW